MPDSHPARTGIRVVAAALVAGVALALPAIATATEVALPTSASDAGYGAWSAFVVDDFAAPSYGLGWIDAADGSALTFTFSVAAGSVGRLTVVDGGFAGDTFAVFKGTNILGVTSTVPTGTFEQSPNVGDDFDAALADPAFSQGVFLLSAGVYQIGGALGQSVTLAGSPLNSTLGAVRLTVSPVPEPSGVALTIAGLGVLTVALRRRRG